MALVYSRCGVERKPFSLGVLAGVLLLHTGLLFALAGRQAETPPIPTEAPILISLIQAEAPPAPMTESRPMAKIKPVPPTPKPARKLPTPMPDQRPIVTADPAPPLVAQTVAPMVAAAAIAEQKAAVDTVSPPQAEPAKPAEASPPGDEPQELPRFHADYLDNPPPAYPTVSRRLGEYGRVLLRVRVSAGGEPIQVLLRESSGHARLDERAVETVRKWKFVPARQGGQLVEAWVIVPIQFSLKG